MALSNDWNDVNNATEQPIEFWAKVTSVDKKYFVFQGKGNPKRPYDAATDDEADARLFICLEFESLKGKVWVQEILVSSKDWTNHTWKSAKELGFLDVREMVGKWFLLTDVESGQYKAKVFKAFKNTREEVEAEKNDGNGNGHTTPPAAQPAQAAPQATDERAMAFTLVTALAKTARGNKDLLATQIAQYPVVSKFYTINSPEVVALLAQAA